MMVMIMIMRGSDAALLYYKRNPGTDCTCAFTVGGVEFTEVRAWYTKSSKHPSVGIVYLGNPVL